jgi:RNA polymerase subunit RPABC4/transcription elongation factor Spt4
MALIKCEECGRSISSAAPICPGCGHPQKKSTHIWKTVIVATAVAIALAAFLYRNKSPLDAAANTPADMRVTAPSPVCREEVFYNKIMSLILQRDRDGAEKLLGPAIAKNECQMLETGQRVALQKGTIFGSPCVRWSGEPECWYISPTLIEVIP